MLTDDEQLYIESIRKEAYGGNYKYTLTYPGRGVKSKRKYNRYIVAKLIDLRSAYNLSWFDLVKEHVKLVPNEPKPGWWGLRKAINAQMSVEKRIGQRISFDKAKNVDFRTWNKIRQEYFNDFSGGMPYATRVRIKDISTYILVVLKCGTVIKEKWEKVKAFFNYKSKIDRAYDEGYKKGEKSGIKLGKEAEKKRKSNRPETKSYDRLEEGLKTFFDSPKVSDNKNDEDKPK